MGASGIYAGLRILELGAGAAGPVATRYFAEQGATVIRVESATRPDFLRTLHARPGEPIDLDAAPMFALLNPDKWSVAINLQKPAGVALALRLADQADVVSQNFAPGAMEKLGLGPAQLLERKPSLIVVTSALFGQTGPQRSYPGFGGQGAAIAGFNHLTGWPDRESIGPYATITDSLSPRYVALLIAAALLERSRSGRGQHIDVAQIETGVYSLSEMVVRCSANGESPSRAGNREAGSAPHGVYPCAGDDAWIAITVTGDDEWQALVSVMNDPAWARDARFASAQAREAHQDDLDARIGRWTRSFGAYLLMARLQEAGVPAGVVQHLDEALRDPQLAHRHHFVQLDHAALGVLPYERSGFRLSASPGGFDDSGPLLGEDNDTVLGESAGALARGDRTARRGRSHRVNLRDSPEQARFRSEVRGWLVANLPAGWGTPAFSEPASGEERVAFGRAWQRKLFDGGFAGLEWPREFGGRGATAIEALIFGEESARVRAPEPIQLAVGTHLVGPTLIACGTEAQKARHLAPILRGDEVWCQGFSEPNAGSDLASLRTRGAVQDDAIVVTGQKIWTSFAQHAQWCILVVRTDPDSQRHRGLSFLLVDMPTPGSRSDRCANSPATRGSTRCSSTRCACRARIWSGRCTAAGTSSSPRSRTSAVRRPVSRGCAQRSRNSARWRAARRRPWGRARRRGSRASATGSRSTGRRSPRCGCPRIAARVRSKPAPCQGRKARR